MPDPNPPPPSSLSPAHWSTQQLTGFLATVSSASDERTAIRLAVERAAEALDAEVAALLRSGEVYVSIGFPSDPALEQALTEVAEGRTDTLMAPGLGECSALAIEVEDQTAASLVLARRTGGRFAVDELQLARGMARVLGLSLRLFRLAADRLGLETWKSDVEQKLDTMDDIYRFAVEQSAMSRGQFLELTVVVILVLELILILMGVMQ